MPKPVEGLPEVYEDMIEVLLVLVRLWLQSVQYDLQHDFAWVADEADCSVILALLQVAFLGSLQQCNEKNTQCC